MKPTTVNLLNRVVYLGFGLLLGLQITQLWESSDENLHTDNAVILKADISDSGSPIKNTEIKVFLEQVVRNEIKTQMTNYIARSEENSHVEPLHQASNNRMNESPLSDNSSDEYSEQQQVSYQLAEQVIEDAMASSHWNEDIATQLVNHLNVLTPEQEFAIRAKYANAINEGLIVPDMPLELINSQ